MIDSSSRIPIVCADCGKTLGYMNNNSIFLFCKICKKEKPTKIKAIVDKALN